MREHPGGPPPEGPGWDLDPRPGLVDSTAIRGILRHRRDPHRPLDTQASGGSRHPPRLNRPVVRGRDLQQIAR